MKVFLSGSLAMWSPPSPLLLGNPISPLACTARPSIPCMNTNQSAHAVQSNVLDERVPPWFIWRSATGQLLSVDTITRNHSEWNTATIENLLRNTPSISLLQKGTNLWSILLHPTDDWPDLARTNRPVYPELVCGCSQRPVVTPMNFRTGSVISSFIQGFQS